MLEGLEITIFNKSDILIDNEEFRIDAEYYRKEFLKLYRNIQNAPILENLVYMSDLSTNGSFKTVSNIVNDDNPKIIPFIRSGNTGSPFIKTSELIFISEEAHNKLPKSTTHLHDIIMARKGKIGGASLIMEDEVNFNCNENVIKLDINDKEYLNPFYFTTYFNSKYGLKQIERLSTGNVQPWVSIFQIRKLKIPILKTIFQQQIEIVFRNAHSAISNSKQKYTQAETLLLQEIGLAPLLSNETITYLENQLNEKFNPTINDILKPNSNTKPDALDKIYFLKEEIERINNLEKDAYYQNILEKEKLITELETTYTSLKFELKSEKIILDLLKKHNQNVKNISDIKKATKENINIKSFAASFGTSGRLDAEYYQPKYERIEKAIKTYKNGFDTLDAFIKDFSTGYPYKSKSYIKKEGIPLIRINNIKKGHLSLDNAIQIPKKDLELSPKDVAVENDILISMSGTIGNTCKIPKGIKAVVNQRIMKITPQNYNFEVLPLVINSIIGELQLNRIGTGGVQTNISSTDIKKIFIPKIVEEKQQQIANLIEESFALKKQSKHLLEIAKKAVEIAIEENEEVALKYIQEN